MQDPLGQTDTHDAGKADAGKGKPKRRRGRLLKIGALLMFATALTLILLEVTLRFAPVPLQQLQALEGLRGCYQVNSQGLLETVPDWSGELTVDGQTHTVQMNSLGLRNPEIPPRVDGERAVNL